MTKEIQQNVFYTVLLIGLLYLCFIVITENLEDKEDFKRPPKPLGEIEATVHEKGQFCYVMKYSVRYDHNHSVCWDKEDLR